jgi:hypothetical protein
MVPINLSEYVLKNLIRQVVQESSICRLVSVEMNDTVVIHFFYDAKFNKEPCIHKFIFLYKLFVGNEGVLSIKMFTILQKEKEKKEENE